MSYARGISFIICASEFAAKDDDSRVAQRAIRGVSKLSPEHDW